MDIEKRRTEIQRILNETLELRARAIVAAQEAENRIQQLQGQLALINELQADGKEKMSPKNGKPGARRVSRR